jgi:glycosidase
VATMETDASSILSFFKKAVRLRRTHRALLYGDYGSIGTDPNVFAYRRRADGQEVIVLLNMSGEPTTFDLGAGGLPASARLEVALSNVASGGSAVRGPRVPLAPFEAVALEVLR